MSANFEAPANGRSECSEWVRLAAVAVFTLLIVVLVGMFTVFGAGGSRSDECRADVPPSLLEC